MNERTVFLEALEQPTPERRQGFLAQACGDDAELRRKVDDLLRAHEDAGSFIEHSPVGVQTTKIRGEADDTDDRTAQFHTANQPSLPSDINLSFLSPSSVPHHLGKLGPYEILEVMGRGAFGIVLRALDPKLNRVVAIKVLMPELATNAMSVKRFRKEAQAAAAVSHEHIVTIHAVDDETSLPYIVMECIIGQSLQQKIDKQGALPVSEILRIGVQIASGLAAAHKNGLVHRDIKPANILLENGVQRVKITDFGLARAVDDLAHTQTFQVAGTPQYMSPEQAHGEVIDQRSDLFSLGSVLYTMCTGRPAFRAESMMGILKRVCDDTPRPICEVNSEIPDWLGAIVARLMEKKPQDRYQSAAEVAELLRNHLAEVQQNPSHVDQAPKRVEPKVVRQNPSKSSWVPIVIVLLVLVAASGFVLLSAAGLAMYYFQGFPSEHLPIFEEMGSESKTSVASNESQVSAGSPKSDTPWIDLLQPEKLKSTEWTKGAQWKNGALVLSSHASNDYVQVWPVNLRLRNARMRLKVLVSDATTNRTIKLGWDHQSGSPRRLDAVLANPAVGTTRFAAWKYNEAFATTLLQEFSVSADWTKPITLTCEIRNEQVTAQFEGTTIEVAHGLDPERRVVPLLGVENTTVTVLEWQVQDLDASTAPSVDPVNPASTSPAH